MSNAPEIKHLVAHMLFLLAACNGCQFMHLVLQAVQLPKLPFQLLLESSVLLAYSLQTLPANRVLCNSK
jgi:hypothetical protein